METSMSRQDLLEIYRSATPVIAPSMLGCDFGNLHREVELLTAAGAPMLHLDVMDGHFVPNLTYGPVVIRQLRSLTRLPLDAHLMISDPAQYLDEFLDAGCDGITVHVECFSDSRTAMADVLERIQAAGAVAGIAVNPSTPITEIQPLLNHTDQVLIMSVEPGFGGQAFQVESLEKLRQLSETDKIIAIDGGIGPETIGLAYAAGARMFVCGSAIFDAPDYSAALQTLRSAATSVTTVQEAC
jgi:ribulose-phosphate 3-epimerase